MTHDAPMVLTCTVDDDNDQLELVIGEAIETEVFHLPLLHASTVDIATWLTTSFVEHNALVAGMDDDPHERAAELDAIAQRLSREARLVRATRKAAKAKVRA